MNNQTIINNYIQGKEDNNVSINTLKQYKHSTSILMRWLKGNKRQLIGLTLKDAEDYKHYLKTYKARGKTLTSRTRQYHTTVLKGIVKYMRKHNLNTLDEGDITLNKAEKRADIIWTDAMIDRVRQYVGIKGKYKQRDKALFEVIVQTGMRVSECIALDRDLIQQAITHQQQANEDYIEVSIIGKSKKPRTITIFGEALLYLTQYLNSRHDNNPALFATDTGRLNRQRVYVIFKRASKEAGVADFSPHQARHYLGMRLARKGINQSIIRDALGHQHTATTDRYVRVAAVDIRKALME